MRLDAMPPEYRAKFMAAPHTFWLELALIGLSPAEYELEIGLGSEQILVNVLLPKDSTADPAKIADCLEQDPMIQTNVIKEEAE